MISYSFDLVKKISLSVLIFYYFAILSTAIVNLIGPSAKLSMWEVTGKVWTSLFLIKVCNGPIKHPNTWEYWCRLKKGDDNDKKLVDLNRANVIDKTKSILNLSSFRNPSFIGKITMMKSLVIH